MLLLLLLLLLLSIGILVLPRTEAIGKGSHAAAAALGFVCAAAAPALAAPAIVHRVLKVIEERGVVVVSVLEAVEAARSAVVGSVAETRRGKVRDLLGVVQSQHSGFGGHRRRRGLAIGIGEAFFLLALWLGQGLALLQGVLIGC